MMTMPASQPDSTSTATSPLTDEIRDLKTQLTEAQKLAVLGTAAGMLAHEYNNIFTPIISYAKYALDTDDVELMRKSITLMLKQYDAVKSMSDRTLGLMRDDAEQRGTVDLKQIVEDAAACIFRDLAKDRIQLNVQIEEGIEVHGNANQLQQVFFNLMINSRQALLDRGGQIKVSATPISEDRVSIHFRDSGKGISADNLEKIFEPFFSTKRAEGTRERRGLGLGLSICKSIIEDHRGMMAVESIENYGTTFTITLPTCPVSATC